MIAVKVDNSVQPNSRWYSGSGIYRNVWLVTTNKVAIDHWGTYVTTPEVSDQSATVHIQTHVKNYSGNPAKITVTTTIYGPAGKPVITIGSAELEVTASSY